MSLSGILPKFIKNLNRSCRAFHKYLSNIFPNHESSTDVNIQGSDESTLRYLDTIVQFLKININLIFHKIAKNKNLREFTVGDEGFDNDPRGNGHAARKVSWRHIFIKWLSEQLPKERWRENIICVHFSGYGRCCFVQ